MFIDTHSHPYTEEFDDDREAVIARAREAGAEMILLPNINEASVGPMLELCEKHPDFCRPMMGLHPTELPDTAEEVETALNHMERLLEAPNHPYIAIGEVGIDLYWDESRREEQVAILQRQAEWAARFHLPLVIHSRSLGEATACSLTRSCRLPTECQAAFSIASAEQRKRRRNFLTASRASSWALGVS